MKCTRLAWYVGFGDSGGLGFRVQAQGFRVSGERKMVFDHERLNGRHVHVEVKP